MLLVPKTKKETPVSSKDTKTLEESLSKNVKAINSLIKTHNKNIDSEKVSKKEYIQLYTLLKKSPLSKSKDEKVKKQYTSLLSQLKLGPTDNKKNDISRKDYEALLSQIKNGPKEDSKTKDTKKKWQKIVGIMGKGIGGLFKGVASIVKGLAGKTTGLIGFLLGIFILLKLGLLKTLIPAALDLLTTLVEGIIKILPDVIKWAWDIIVKYVPKIVNAFANAISDALGLGKDSKLRKIMPILVGIGTGLLTLFKVANLFFSASKIFGVISKGLGMIFSSVMKAVKFIPVIINAFKLLASFLLANPFVAATAAIVAAGIGIYAFVKHSEDISKWAKKNKKEMLSQDKADEALINKYKGKDISKLSAKQYADLQEAYKRQDSIWRDVKKGFFSATESVAGGINNVKKAYQENDEAIFKLQMKKKLTDKEQEELSRRIIAKGDMLSKKYWSSQLDLIKRNGKKMNKALSEVGKSIGGYWDKIKQDAKDVWNKLPSATSIKEKVSNNIQSVEDYLKPFIKKMEEIFINIGDVFSKVAHYFIWGISKLPRVHIKGAEGVSAKEFDVREITSDPENVKIIEKYISAKKAGKDTGDIAISNSMKKVAEALIYLKKKDIQQASRDMQVNNDFLKTVTNSMELTRKINGK